MVGIIGIVAFIIVLGLSLLVTRVATVALSMTGLSHQVAKFQARSAFTAQVLLQVKLKKWSAILSEDRL
mgnify:CR=1 FL=1